MPAGAHLHPRCILILVDELFFFIGTGLVLCFFVPIRLPHQYQSVLLTEVIYQCEFCSFRKHLHFPDVSVAFSK